MPTDDQSMDKQEENDAEYTPEADDQGMDEEEEHDAEYTPEAVPDAGHECFM